EAEGVVELSFDSDLYLGSLAGDLGVHLAGPDNYDVYLTRTDFNDMATSNGISYTLNNDNIKFVSHGVYSVSIDSAKDLYGIDGGNIGSGENLVSSYEYLITDNEIPIITLLGNNPVSIEVGATYADAGATALDNVDGNITPSIVVVNPVDTAIVGAYTITYNVSDVAGNAAVEVTRTVNVVETLGLDSTDLNKVSVYPNPTASKWTIESSRIINTLTLFNLLGQKVLEQTANEMKVSIDASNLKTGVYMLKINTTAIKRVLKR
ncbi:DUF5011 domain-containing protein, partial [Polaribacter sp.]|nr:DUF5011 domain-containing protein [Polaribacter sp.]